MSADRLIVARSINAEMLTTLARLDMKKTGDTFTPVNMYPETAAMLLKLSYFTIEMRANLSAAALLVLLKLIELREIGDIFPQGTEHTFRALFEAWTVPNEYTPMNGVVVIDEDALRGRLFHLSSFLFQEDSFAEARKEYVGRLLDAVASKLNPTS